jgi:hypothetical protein
MAQHDRFVIYESGKHLINVLIDIQGTTWFCASDVLAMAKLKYQSNTLQKLSVTETSKRTLNGSSKRFVTLPGLLALIPAKFNYSEARKALVELILEFGAKGNQLTHPDTGEQKSKIVKMVGNRLSNDNHLPAI